MKHQCKCERALIIAVASFHNVAADKEKGEPITLAAGPPLKFPRISSAGRLLCGHSAAAVVFLTGEIWKAKQGQGGQQSGNGPMDLWPMVKHEHRSMILGVPTGETHGV